MDPISIITLLVSTGLATQAFKFILNLVGASPDRKYTPAIAALIGALNDALVLSPDGTVGDAFAGGSPAALLQAIMEGATIGGLGATGAHQLLFSKNYVKAGDSAAGGTIRGFLPYLLPLMLMASLSGCSLFKSDQAKAFDFRVKTDQGCQSLVMLSNALGEKKVIVDELGPEALRSYLALQTVIQILGSNCKA